ncbi:hypothetical protein [Croceicoccus marinus]|jgi:hypothetical protein|nr:hypothetical protein [Croceicoccus marinus]
MRLGLSAAYPPVKPERRGLHDIIDSGEQLLPDWPLAAPAHDTVRTAARNPLRGAG